MHADTDLHELLYISSIASTAQFDAVGQIARHARQANVKVHITGLLIFDGERFCQYLEGHADDVNQLFKRIEVDPRHQGVRLLHRGESAQRQFRRFSMGFASVDDADLLKQIDDGDGAAARAAFIELVPLIDMEP